MGNCFDFKTSPEYPVITSILSIHSCEANLFQSFHQDDLRQCPAIPLDERPAVGAVHARRADHRQLRAESGDMRQKRYETEEPYRKRLAGPVANAQNRVRPSEFRAGRVGEAEAPIKGTDQAPDHGARYEESQQPADRIEHQLPAERRNPHIDIVDHEADRG